MIFFPQMIYALRIAESHFIISTDNLSLWGKNMYAIATHLPFIEQCEKCPSLQGPLSAELN